jgi:MerR family transcriptional regulator, redox-sensitive transcriptional activator SoxR
MKIGDLANRAGINASAVRYYEKRGLLVPPYRISGQRRYSVDTVHRVLLIRFASDMGFTLGEIKLFLSGLRDKAPVGDRWRKLARRKIKAVDETIQRSRRLKSLLEHLLQCNCASLEICIERLSLSASLRLVSASADRRRRPTPARARRVREK